MNAPLSPAARARISRGRIRTVLVILLGATWVLPQWVQAQVGDSLVDQIGAMRTGAPAALALLALFALAATCWLATSSRGLRVGEAVSATCTATAMTFLLATDHPWIPGDAMREIWVPIFGPLAALSLLDAWQRHRFASSTQEESHNDGESLELDASHEQDNLIARIRGTVACLAAIALAIHEAYLPAAAAAWIGIPALMLDMTSTRTSHARILNAMFLASSVVAGLAPMFHDRLVGADAIVGTATTWPVYAWSILCALLATTTLGALFGTDDERAAAAVRP